MNIQNRTLMTKNLITIPLNMSLKDAVKIMKAEKIRHLPVVDETDGIVGILSSKDFPLFGDHENMTVEFFMSSPAIYVMQDLSIKKTIEQMLDNKISSVLVADDDEYAVGIITTEYLLRYLLSQVEKEPQGANSYLHRILNAQTLGQIADKISLAGV